MKVRVAINGFGRIGRNAFRVAFDRDDVEVVAINDLTDNEMLAHLLKYDTNYGAYHHDVSVDNDCIVVDGTKIPVTSEKDPSALPWADRQVDVVIESTGFFTTTEKAVAHIKAGAKKVVISAPAKDDETQTVVLGANEHDLEAHSGDVISNASCTTNSLAAVMDVLDQEFGVAKAMLTTVHSYTADQRLQDAPHKDFRRARAAAQNIVPTSTGAALAVAKTVPSLHDKFDGMAIRVPTSVVSLSDVTLLLNRDVSKEEVNAALHKASQDLYYQGIIDYTEEPLVSSDYIGNSHSGIVDGGLTNVVDGNLVKVVVWYDNEWGYSNRLVELVADVGNALHSQAAAAPVADEPNTADTPKPEVVAEEQADTPAAQVEVAEPAPVNDPGLAEAQAAVEESASEETIPTPEVATAESDDQQAATGVPEPPAETAVQAEPNVVSSEMQYQDISLHGQMPATNSDSPEIEQAVVAAEHPVSVAYDDVGDANTTNQEQQPAMPEQEGEATPPPPPPPAADEQQGETTA